ncbi:uncharacterized protein LOC105435561 [Cucumis sativus]|uniref:Pyrrolidone-carboxylate peptidase n=1 Tax=Cucumis sativus TaxID=3659 RepID=A0A0A0KSB2_CUCSA|nr:uncharacterized protein LOC105435561 [Cucumis sativus]KGN51794.1 hypothetical protein Csa_009003 [Cucumis sativus]
MGSEGPSGVTIHVTGFKKFHGVAENPTEAIVSDLKAFVEEKGLPAGVTLGSCTVLDAAGDGALPVLQKVLESGVSNVTETNKVVWLHLGVNSGSTRFAIEWQAVNEATFRYADEHGWQPQKLPIVSEDGEISMIRKTSCSALVILEKLKAKSYNVILSTDAGRFVCNYVYYHSLRFAEQKGHKSLFVHVPLFSKIDKETQMRFIHSLLEAIASTC